METNQPTKSDRREPVEAPKTFQDDLFATMKIFWKAGYSYGTTGHNEDFYARTLEDFMNLPYQEFLNKYGN
jgi:hypothetical protein